MEWNGRASKWCQSIAQMNAASSSASSGAGGVGVGAALSAAALSASSAARAAQTIPRRTQRSCSHVYEWSPSIRAPIAQRHAIQCETIISITRNCAQPASQGSAAARRRQRAAAAARHAAEGG